MWPLAWLSVKAHLQAKQEPLARTPERSSLCERTQLLEPGVYIKAVKQEMKEEGRDCSNNKAHIKQVGRGINSLLLLTALGQSLLQLAQDPYKTKAIPHSDRKKQQTEFSN